MDKLTMFLKENNTPFDIGIINNGYYHKLLKPFKDKQVIRFKWKKNSINKLLSNLTKIGIILKENAFNKLQEIMTMAGELTQKAPYEKIVNNSYAEKVIK